jgi:hypothetical protein
MFFSFLLRSFVVVVECEFLRKLSIPELESNCIEALLVNEESGMSGNIQVH